MMISNHRTMISTDKEEYEKNHPHLNPPPSRGRKEGDLISPLPRERREVGVFDSLSSKGRKEGDLISPLPREKKEEKFFLLCERKKDYGHHSLASKGKREKEFLPPNAGEGQDGGNIQKARELRKRLTDAEKKLWRHLRLRQIEGCKFRRQQPIGKYIVDFVCFEKKLIIELDGGHHVSQRSYDSNRTDWLEPQGYKVIRFWNNEVLGEIGVVLDVIVNEINRREISSWEG